MVLGIYGSGGAGKEVKDIAEMLNKWSEIVFIDDTVDCDFFKGIKRMPWSVFCKTYSSDDSEIVISLGEPEYKLSLSRKIKQHGYSLGNVFHPGAWISPSAIIGHGVVLRMGAIVQADTVIGDNVTIMEYSGVGHDSIVGNNVQIAAGVLVGGHCTIGDNTYISVGVLVKEKICIGSNSIVGIGSVVSRNIDENVVALGNPARAMKMKDNSKVFM